MPENPLVENPVEETDDAEKDQASQDKQEDEIKPVDNKKIADQFKSEVEKAQRNRRQLYNEWKRNVELRIGKIASQFTGGVGVEDEVQTEINPDWSLTKTKTANLYSQVPTVQLTHENKRYDAAISPFARSINYEIGEKRSNIGAAMEEVLNDAVNAAGVGGIFISYVARFEEKKVPAIDQQTMQALRLPPEVLSQLQPVDVSDGLNPQQLLDILKTGKMPMRSVSQVVSYKFPTDRISPTDLLWPAEFVGSDFNKGPWIGHADRMSWAEAVNEFKLEEDMKDKVISGADLHTQDDLRSQPEKVSIVDNKSVRYKEIFYWRYKVDPQEKHLDAIWRLVWVSGLDEPVIHEPWKGQQLDEQSNKYVGSVKFPIQLLTLTYVTDNPIPPSDSSAGRPQVNDLRRSRSMMFQNRQRSIPIRWFDVNRIGKEVQSTLMRGTVQGMIPTNGQGDKCVGEVARASYPTEDHTFDVMSKQDLMESWQIGPEQLGIAQGGRKGKAQVEVSQGNFATRIGQERGRVAHFFLSCVEVVAGLMALYSDFPLLDQQERQAMEQAWDSKHILHNLAFKIRPDSQIVMDTSSRLERLYKFLNLTAKSGYVNVKPIIVEIAELTGLDPAEVIIQPQPKPPEEPNISFRFTGKDDMMNPMVIALLRRNNKLPSPQEIEEAKQLLLSLAQPPQPPQPQGTPGPAAGAAPGAHPPAPGAPLPNGAPVEGHNANWNLMPKVAKRSRDMSGSGG